jgi:hypothetical protein
MKQTANQGSEFQQLGSTSHALSSKGSYHPTSVLSPQEQLLHDQSQSIPSKQNNTISKKKKKKEKPWWFNPKPPRTKRNKLYPIEIF